MARIREFPVAAAIALRSLPNAVISIVGNGSPARVTSYPEMLSPSDARSVIIECPSRSLALSHGALPSREHVITESYHTRCAFAGTRSVAGIVPPMDDHWLSTREVAELCGITSADLRSRLAKGLAPPPDDPDAEAVPQRRAPRWLASTARRWARVRPRTSAARASARLVVIDEAERDASRPWVVVDIWTAHVAASAPTRQEAEQVLRALRGPQGPA